MNDVIESTGRIEAEAVSVAPPSRVDFERPLVCILGLPFDAIGLGQAVQRIRAAAFDGRRCFVSTPNLNFAIAAQTDAAFRDSVLRSDLSLVDGKPLVWIARLLGLPIRERVAGADVFEALQAHAGPPLRVYLFGAPPGVAARACEQINRRGGGLRCVGFETPGFGAVESMSSAAQIERINASGAHFVIAALGAKKGQAWLEHSAAQLTAPVLSPLGAVVNFAAGAVPRAPRWMQRSGLEWAWRIRAEPSLWRRYWSDGLGTARLLFTRVLPDAIDSRLRRRGDGALPPRVELRPGPMMSTLLLHGSWRRHDPGALRNALAECAARGAGVRIDLSGVTGIGSSFVAILLLACGWFDRRGGFELVGVDAATRSALHRKLVEKALCSRNA